MSYNENNAIFSKDNIDLFLKELAKEFRKLNGKHMKAELILIGGASVLINYNFRDMTTDIDAIIHASSAMKDAINNVGDKLGLPNGWLNSDFTKTSSYSSKIAEVSKYYKTYSNVLEIRTVDAEYLIAMKLCSSRQYKHDRSDIVGIRAECSERGTPLTFDKINNAVILLYKGWDKVSNDMQEALKDYLKCKDYNSLYLKIKEEERQNKMHLIQFEKNYPKTLTSENLDSILNSLKQKEITKTSEYEICD